MESKLWQNLKGQLEQCSDWRDLASTYMLHPSDSSVHNFKLEGLEVSEYAGMSDKSFADGSEGQNILGCQTRVCRWVRGSEGWKCCREDMKVEVDSIFN